MQKTISILVFLLATRTGISQDKLFFESIKQKINSSLVHEENSSLKSQFPADAIKTMTVPKKSLLFKISEFRMHPFMAYRDLIELNFYPDSIIKTQYYFRLSTDPENSDEKLKKNDWEITDKKIIRFRDSSVQYIIKQIKEIDIFSIQDQETIIDSLKSRSINVKIPCYGTHGCFTLERLFIIETSTKKVFRTLSDPQLYKYNPGVEAFKKSHLLEMIFNIQH